MKAMLRQTAILVLIALAPSQASEAFVHTSKSASEGHHSSNLDPLRSFQQSTLSEQKAKPYRLLRVGLD